MAVGVLVAAAAFAALITLVPGKRTPAVMIADGTITTIGIPNLAVGEVLWDTRFGAGGGPVAVIERSRFGALVPRSLDPTIRDGTVPVQVVDTIPVSADQYVVAGRVSRSGAIRPLLLPAGGSVWLAHAYSMDPTAETPEVRALGQGLVWRGEESAGFLRVGSHESLEEGIKILLTLEDPESAGMESIDAVASIDADSLSGLTARDRAVFELAIANFLEEAAADEVDRQPATAPNVLSYPILELAGPGIEGAFGAEVSLPRLPYWCELSLFKKPVAECHTTGNSCVAIANFYGAGAPESCRTTVPTLADTTAEFSIMRGARETAVIPAELVPDPHPGCSRSAYTISLVNRGTGTVLLNWMTHDQVWILRKVGTDRLTMHLDADAPDAGRWLVVPGRVGAVWTAIVDRCAGESDAPEVLYRVFGDPTGSSEYGRVMTIRFGS